MFYIFKKKLKVTIEEYYRLYRSVKYSSIVTRLIFFLKLFAFFPFALLTFVLLSVMNVFQPIRLGLLSAKGRISAMIPPIEACVRKINLEEGKRPLIILINPGMDPNEQLTKMYKRVIWLLDEKNEFLRFLFAVVHVFFSCHSKTGILFSRPHGGEFSEAWQHGGPLISFTQEEHRLGEEFLRSLGIPEGAKYICIGLRELSYYTWAITREMREGVRSDTEHLRDLNKLTFIHNPCLSSYLPALINCVKQGFYIVYMGQFSEKRLPANLLSEIVDYSPDIRTEFRDVYLIGNCEFTIVAGASGLTWMVLAFNKPLVITDNYSLVVKGLRKGDLCIPKKWFIKNENRFFSFKEIISKSANYFCDENCKKDGVEPIHNTPEEIDDVIQEMVQRLNGIFKTIKEDEVLQRKFENLFEPKNPAFNTYGRIGTKFLRENSDLL